MNTLFSSPVGASSVGHPARGWCLEARRAMSLRPRVRGWLQITQGQAWVTLGTARRGPGRDSGDLVLAAGEGVAVPAGARVVVEPWQPVGAGPVRFDWCFAPEGVAAQPPDRLGREVLTPARELVAALGQAGVALGRLTWGLLGYSEFLVAGRGRVRGPWESNPP